MCAPTTVVANSDLDSALDSGSNLASAIRLDTESFLKRLAALYSSIAWEMAIEDGCIHLRRTGAVGTSEYPRTIFSPLTAVYYDLTGEIIHRGSFWMPELTEGFGFPWWEVLAVTYASIACDCAGHQYSRALRNRILAALGAPVTLVPSQL